MKSSVVQMQKAESDDPSKQHCALETRGRPDREIGTGTWL